MEQNSRKVCLPHISKITDRIAKILKRRVGAIFTPTQKIRYKLWSIKDTLDSLLTPGVLGIPCECGKDYIGMTQRIIATQKKGHERALCLQQPDKAAIAQHPLEEHHGPNWNQPP